ncbi:AfsR/SARP family transcriptional regulator [Streptomyces sp. TRM49041]|uniref:AfsR/SARP family transcriptional regulator n=1 Tax=Streptomyces sp. TRM49041 TaxID=2603216 RepID=UPI0021CCA087|nr:AfsR/SARP family transcriptional regulator [Streptomyces sp. TRM49041]
MTRSRRCWSRASNSFSASGPEIQLGGHREFLPELRTLVNDHPRQEWFHGWLISALHSVGRRGEALQVYKNLYTILKRELGLEPSTELKRMQAEILHSHHDDALRLKQIGAPPKVRRRRLHPPIRALPGAGWGWAGGVRTTRLCPPG